MKQPSGRRHLYLTGQMCLGWGGGGGVFTVREDHWTPPILDKSQVGLSPQQPLHPSIPPYHPSIFPTPPPPTCRQNIPTPPTPGGTKEISAGCFHGGRVSLGIIIAVRHVMFFLLLPRRAPDVPSPLTDGKIISSRNGRRERGRRGEERRTGP